MKHYNEGTFCWAELGSGDPAASTGFYTALFPWTTQSTTMEDGRSYTVFQSDEQDVAAMYSLGDTELPSFWGCYIAVQDVGIAAERAVSLGAEIIIAPRSIGDKGVMCAFRDPTGAMVALWEAAEHRGSGVQHEPYSIDWHELYTTDLDTAAHFYTELLGWSMEEVPTPSGRYLQFKAGADYAAGIKAIPRDMVNMSSGWGLYFKVPGCGEIIRQAVALGGTVVIPPTPVPGGGTFATLQDPQGAFFSIQQGF
ncbi:VOC family protein [Paenibacillus albidus]|uniref:VOC family protein n=1 Tax=Paenibacillus albidus TaxID=2041023 RepID=UPI001BE78320|nr:VOC family protein [Paenibacillus albidus]MBT2291728.1 VOC family protein [Paenibacillus albidus]